jgi:hypothetical protein
MRRRTSSRVKHEEQETKGGCHKSDIDTIKQLFVKGASHGKKNRCIVFDINSRVDKPEFELVKAIAACYEYKLESSSEKYHIESKSIDYHLVFSPI